MAQVSAPDKDSVKLNFSLQASSQSNSPRTFPAGFLWGVSTSAHQVEGDNGNNQWSAWESAGRIKSGECSGLACDWWKNAERDFDLVQEFGLNALRISVEWSRIEPQPGVWDVEALQRYRQILQGLLSRGIEPMVCLHHFTHPIWFEQQGGFLGPDAVKLFERFTLHVLEELGDLCNYWITFNEPNVFASLGWVLGEFPPGGKGQIPTALRVVQGMLQCHARAYHAIHEIQSGAQVGWAHNYVVFEPANRASILDRCTAATMGSLFNESFLAQIESGRSAFPSNLLNCRLSSVKGTCDFVGLNVYSRFHVAFSLRHPRELFGHVFVPPEVPQGDSGIEKPYGEAYPAAIAQAVRRASRLGKPIYILENGVPDAKDRIRPWLIVNALQELHQLIEEGHDVRGYFHWTLADNFEWAEGWNLRFGLVALDPMTQLRTVRDSGRLYGEIARTNALSPEMIEKFSTTPLEK
ncbi:MAG: glycoside hydrolase family 1 protein [Acidobacteriota bacterium]|nr:glycoside hydrolase family 1 protein [Acidobacteriota bacterium]